IRGGDADEILADEYLPGPGLRCDSSGDVDGPAEVIAFVVDHRSRVHSDVGRWEAARADALDDLEGCSDPIARIAEVEVHPIAEHLHDLTPVPRRDLADELGERQRHLG